MPPAAAPSGQLRRWSLRRAAPPQAQAPFFSLGWNIASAPATIAARTYSAGPGLVSATPAATATDSARADRAVSTTADSDAVITRAPMRPSTERAANRIDAPGPVITDVEIHKARRPTATASTSLAVEPGCMNPQTSGPERNRRPAAIPPPANRADAANAPAPICASTAKPMVIMTMPSANARRPSDRPSRAAPSQATKAGAAHGGRKLLSRGNAGNGDKRRPQRRRAGRRGWLVRLLP